MGRGGGTFGGLLFFLCVTVWKPWLSRGLSAWCNDSIIWLRWHLGLEVGLAALHR
ncbi:hypothetical protein KC19_VG255500 [Ceratodon purpureus]|uniref:Uncharacterized protein n=1 Tax=Ceratodon purpureus TaxID=3225 RepID=A0A8T0HUC8_CERPU|nr:hypothetical protein KC19_VG255500 [Ceratodon purpureus]